MIVPFQPRGCGVVRAGWLGGCNPEARCRELTSSLCIALASLSTRMSRFAIAAEAELEGAVLAAQKSGVLSDNEVKELVRLGGSCQKDRGPVAEDIL
jgi:hypothetical protein